MSSIGKLPKLQRTSSLQNPIATCLGYGPAGAGKTHSIISLIEEGFSPIVLATEPGKTRGLLSIKTQNVAFLELDSHAMTIDVLRELGKKPGKIEYEQTEFNALVLDSITQWAEYPLDRFIELKGWDDLHGFTAKGMGKDPRQAYGYLAEKGRQLYKLLFALDAHLYIIAREGLFGGGDEPVFAAPELPGQKLARELPGWPDATIRLRRVGGKHRMITTGEGGSPARVRTPSGSPQLPSRCEPNIGALMKFMCGDLEAYKKLVPAGPNTPSLQSTKKP